MKHILLVDDNLSDLNSAANLLNEYYKVSLTSSGWQALRFCEKHMPDLILLDSDMSEISSFEIIKKLKKSPKTKSIPIILLSSSNSSAMEVRGFECGVVDFIVKPLYKSSMIHRLEVHLRHQAYQQHLEEVVEELENSMVISFCKFIKYRNYETGAHAARTRAYVKLLAQELQSQGQYKLDDAYIEMLVQSAPLHDIGKIGISDNVLLQPRELTIDESNEMKKHTVLGAEMLEEIIRITPSQMYLNIAKEIALSHHECYDGSGYPYGLKGEEIPLSARIMAVADVYDALVSHRIYRRGLSHEVACDMIIGRRQSQFDPVVVEAFMNIKDKFYEVAQEMCEKHEI